MRKSCYLFIAYRPNASPLPLTLITVLHKSAIRCKSTTNYNQGDKFRYYRSIAGFREYILIDQYSFHIEQVSKNIEGKWVLTEYECEDSLLVLDSIKFQISLNEVYERVDFELSDEESEKI